MMMWACTCGEWHPLATMDRCDRGEPTADQLNRLVDVLVDAPFADVAPVVDTARRGLSRPPSLVLEVIPRTWVDDG